MPGSKHVKRSILLKEALECNVIVGPISEQTVEVVGERVQEFDHGLIVVAIGWSEKSVHDHPCQTDNGVQLEPEVLHGTARTDPIRSLTDKVDFIACCVCIPRRAQGLSQSRLSLPARACLAQSAGSYVLLGSLTTNHACGDYSGFVRYRSGK